MSKYEEKPMIGSQIVHIFSMNITDTFTLVLLSHDISIVPDWRIQIWYLWIYVLSCICLSYFQPMFNKSFLDNIGAPCITLYPCQNVPLTPYHKRGTCFLLHFFLFDLLQINLSKLFFFDRVHDVIVVIIDVNAIYYIPIKAVYNFTLLYLFTHSE